jgi:UDP-N-acetylmuramate dehydrogenase
MNAQPNVRSPAGLLRDEPMSKHTSWRVGGPADLFFKPRDVEALERFLKELPADMPVLWVGLGSNLLVRDGGIRGAVISTAGFMKDIVRLDECRVRAGSGVPCTILARRCTQWRLGPASFFAGIPGTVGGALAMNAGAFGGETWDRVESVETLDRRGDRRSRQRDEYTIGYRTVSGPAEEWFLSGTWRLEPTEALEPISEVLQKRSASQPLGRPSCGSVFRNPPGDFAGRLIEQAGLKGARSGGARVSSKHANFIINTGTASAGDVESLIERIRNTVRERFGVRLELEVRIVGEPLGGTT